jgi:hypothetical protein
MLDGLPRKTERKQLLPGDHIMLPLRESPGLA